MHAAYLPSQPTSLGPGYEGLITILSFQPPPSIPFPFPPFPSLPHFYDLQLEESEYFQFSFGVKK